MNILHIDSSALGGASVTRELTAATVKAIRAANPSAKVTYRDLAKSPLAHLGGELLAAHVIPAPHEEVGETIFPEA